MARKAYSAVWEITSALRNSKLDLDIHIMHDIVKGVKWICGSNYLFLSRGPERGARRKARAAGAGGGAALPRPGTLQARPVSPDPVHSGARGHHGGPWVRAEGAGVSHHSMPHGRNTERELRAAAQATQGVTR